MEYRKFPRGEEKLSVIGLGSGSLGLASEEEIEVVIKEATNSGINFFDLCARNHKVYKPFGKAIKGVREKVHFQLHFGAVYKADDEYGWSRDLNEIKSTIKEEFDYSLIGWFNSISLLGKCVYCNRCEPCPKGIDIGLVNKYYDLALVGDEIAYNHHFKLKVNACDCIKCGHCNKRCPFKVDQVSRMIE